MTTLVLNSWRQRLGEWIESAPVRHFITALILLNAIVLGVETSAAAEEAAGGLLALLNSVILAVFVAEIPASRAVDSTQTTSQTASSVV